MPGNTEYIIFPLGDAALTIDFGNLIDERINSRLLSLGEAINQSSLPDIVEAVPSYCSLTVYYDVYEASKKSGEQTVFDFISGQLTGFMERQQDQTVRESRLIEMPVCYDPVFAPDLNAVARVKGITEDELVRYHHSREYRVFMLGFLPGFSYMGEIDEKISMPRKSQPSPVAAGSVGIAGRQTGVYPMTCPGGWHIIGRTPLTMFDAQKGEPAFLRPGDRVRFIPITKNEFESY